MLKLTKTCWYRTTNFNVLPAILVTPKPQGFIIAFKLFNRHLGFNFQMNTEMQEQVSEALNNAFENGYDMTEWNDEDIALDMITYSSDFEDADIQELIPYIQTWKTQIC